MCIGESDDAGAVAVEEVGGEVEVGGESKGVRVVEGFRVREGVEDVVEVGERTGRGRATEVVEEEGGRGEEVVGIEGALYEIGG